MKELNVYYRAYSRGNPEGETQLLNVMVTDEAAETITRAANVDRDSFLDTFSGKALNTLHALNKACECIEQLCGQSIFKQGESRPYTYARNGGFALELEAVEDVTDQDPGAVFMGVDLGDPNGDVTVYGAPEYAGGE